MVPVPSQVPHVDLGSQNIQWVVVVTATTMVTFPELLFAGTVRAGAPWAGSVQGLVGCHRLVLGTPL